MTYEFGKKVAYWIVLVAQIGAALFMDAACVVVVIGQIVGGVPIELTARVVTMQEWFLMVAWITGNARIIREIRTKLHTEKVMEEFFKEVRA